MNSQLTVVIEGIGDVVRKYYAPALKAQHFYHSDKLSIIFADESTYWKGNPKEKEFEDFKRSLRGWAKYIDKSAEGGKKTYSKLKGNIVVFIATPDSTHIELALDWLVTPDKCKTIFIEKPLDSDLDKVKKLLPFLEEDSTKIYALDHYRVRMIPIQIKGPYDRLLSHLGGEIAKVIFYLLEDGSDDGTGPIENENRTKALEGGITLDLFPHVLALLNYFGFMQTFRLKGISVAQYSYFDKNGIKKKTSISGETFAHIEFSFKSFRRNKILGEAYIGKGVSGCAELGMVKDVKRLELHGVNKYKCVFDLRNSLKSEEFKVAVEIFDEIGNFVEEVAELYPDPYGELIKRVVNKNLSLSDMPLRFELSYEQAKNFLEIIDEIRQSVFLLKESGQEITEYVIQPKLGGKSGAPNLEELQKLLQEKELKDLIPIANLKDLFKRAGNKFKE